MRGPREVVDRGDSYAQFENPVEMRRPGERRRKVRGLERAGDRLPRGMRRLGRVENRFPRGTSRLVRRKDRRCSTRVDSGTLISSCVHPWE
jgi:hypothetical protein